MPSVIHGFARVVKCAHADGGQSVEAAGPPVADGRSAPKAGRDQAFSLESREGCMDGACGGVAFEAHLHLFEDRPSVCPASQADDRQQDRLFE